MSDHDLDVEEEQLGEGKVRCEACPIRCFIKPEQTGSCDRYGNVDGVLTRMDPVTVLHITNKRGGSVVPFALNAESWSGEASISPEIVIIGSGSGTTYPDYKPAPFIVSSVHNGVDTVTVVTEGIFSYCGVKVKIDTDRHIGDERSLVMHEGEPIGHVSTAEYGSQMLSLGGVHHLTGITKHSGLATMRALEEMCEKRAVELQVEGGASLIIQAGTAPIINGVVEQLMRVGCGSASVGMFAGQWQDVVDEVVVVDEHITGVLTEHQAGAVLGMRPSGIKLRGRRSTPGRYFNVAEPGSGWGGTNISDPLDILQPFKPKLAWPGLRLLMVSTTGDAAEYFVLNEKLEPIRKPLPDDVIPTVEQIGFNCEPALTSVVFMAGAGGSLRAGTTNSPIRLTKSVRNAQTIVTCGGAPVYIWPGGGITFMVDVEKVPPGSFGHVPTPAIVAPIEFTVSRENYVALGGHEKSIREMSEVLLSERVRHLEHQDFYTQ